MNAPSTDARLHAPAVARNRDAILAVLKAHLPPEGMLLEIASGSGEHSIHFAQGLPGYTIQPTDRDERARASISAWIATSGVTNVRPPLALDAMIRPWTIKGVTAILCINMIHISPWAATEGLFAEASRLLAPGQFLFTYGPYKRDGAHTSDSNARFDADLRRENPLWGVRDLEAVIALAAANGFPVPEITQMPANNLTLTFQKR